MLNYPNGREFGDECVLSLFSDSKLDISREITLIFEVYVGNESLWRRLRMKRFKSKSSEMS